MFCCSVVNELIHWEIAQLIQKRVGLQPTEVVVHLASVHDSIFKRFTVMKFHSTVKGLGKLMDPVPSHPQCPVPSHPQCEGTGFTCEPVLGQLCMTQFSQYPLHPRV